MFLNVTENLFRGFGITCLIFFATLIFATPLGLLASFVSMNRWSPLKRIVKSESKRAMILKAFRPISFIMRVFVWIIRGTPLMLQILVIFFVPPLLFHVPPLDRIVATIVAFTINYTCYFSEIFRGDIENMPRGQIEAGLALGMTRRQIFFKISLLQMIKRILPPMSNEIITLVKDTSLARMIAVMEIIYYGQYYMSHDALIWPLFYTGVFFLAFVGILTLLFAHIERKLSYFRL